MSAVRTQITDPVIDQQVTSVPLTAAAAATSTSVTVDVASEM